MPPSAASVNPFRSECVERLRYRLDDAGWRALLDRLAALDHRGALVGPCGSGKTTLLEELRARLESRGLPTVHWRVPRERGAGFMEFLTAAPGRVLLLDGAEQLNWWDWRRVKRAARAAAGLVITTHRPGRLPTLRACGTTPELLMDLVRELTGGTSGRDCADLWRRHGGNVRNALRECYDAWGAGAAERAGRPTAPGLASARPAAWLAG